MSILQLYQTKTDSFHSNDSKRQFFGTGVKWVAAGGVFLAHPCKCIGVSFGERRKKRNERKKERKKERKIRKGMKCEERCLSIFLHEKWERMTGKRERDETAEPKTFFLNSLYLLHFLTFVALNFFPALSIF